ncbi:MAG: UDP-2,4-diacetamido-2,4,6-trideoxy-beta-L-altropyranose hydrolase, partial [Alphaproteobacteria bacterium]
MRAAFRVDASRAIGTGHVGRCLTLAAALRDAGGDALFLCRAHDGHLNAKIEEAGFPVLSLPKRNDTDDDLAHSHWLGATQADDAKASIAALAGHRIDWLVVDHYGLDARWESALRRHAHRILAIDDLADRSHDCDLLLDQNFFLDAASRYDGLLPDHCRPLLGPRYAVLRRGLR